VEGFDSYCPISNVFCRISREVFSLDSLESARGNPLAAVVEAHLLNMETRRDADKRLESKFQIVKQLYGNGYSRQEIVDVFRFIDWIMDLPGSHERLFWDELSRYEEVRKMMYVTSVERIGIEKGMLENAREMVQEAISSRFGTVPEDIAGEIERFEDRERLRVLLRQAVVCRDMEAFRNALAAARN
jgi:hypothetical protein